MEQKLNSDLQPIDNSSASLAQNPMLNAAELSKLTGCKFGMSDCLYRNISKKCNVCEDRSEYDWDYTLRTV